MRRAFTVVELLVVIGIIGLLIGIFLPVIEIARHKAYINTCASNLHSIGQAMVLYANENHGSFPRTIYDSTDPVIPAAGNYVGIPDAFHSAVKVPNDITSAIYLLRKTQKVPASIFVCAYGDVNEFTVDTADPLTTSNFTNYRKNLSYSFANMYPSNDASQKGFQWTNKLGAEFAIAADLNPGVHPPRYDVTAITTATVGSAARGNSGNHEQEGQNVLYGDGHVTFQLTPLCGVARDNIYTNRNGRLDQSPAGKDDSLLLPVD